MEWNFEPVAVHLFGLIEIRWYGIVFAIGLLLGATELQRAFQRRNLSKERANNLTIWLVIGLILGAHFVHLLFYEPTSFIENPSRIYKLGHGLSSHGGGLGCIIVAYIFARRHQASFHQYVDSILTGTVFVIPAVRIGNFFNSEIYGRATDVPWGVVFTQRGFTEPRHPSQLYEAAIGFALLALTWYLERYHRHHLRDGAMFYLVLALYFLTRFFIEWVKEYQILAPPFPFTMGQLLSVPFILFFGYRALFSKEYSFLRPRDPLPIQDTPT